MSVTRNYSNYSKFGVKCAESDYKSNLITLTRPQSQSVRAKCWRKRKMASTLKFGSLITFLKCILKFGGLWKSTGHGVGPFIYRVYSVCFIIVFSLMFTAFMCANLYFLTDILQLTEMLYASMIELALIVKIINFYVNNYKLKHMMHRISAFRMENGEEEAIMRSYLRFLIKQTIIYYISANTSVNTSTAYAAIRDHEKLIYSAYYPGVDWQHNSVSYWLLFAYQYFGMTFTCFINLAIDSYFCIMMYMLSGQIAILGNRLSNVGKYDDGKRRTSIAQRMQLIKLIEMHNEILAVIENLQNCLWWSFLGQLILSTIAVGTVVNGMLRVSELQMTHIIDGSFSPFPIPK